MSREIRMKTKIFKLFEERSLREFLEFYKTNPNVRKGQKRTDATRKKMSDAHMGKIKGHFPKRSQFNRSLKIIFKVITSQG